MQPAESQLLTVADWQQAVRGGVDVGPLLRARRARVFGPDAAPHAWIHRTSAPALEARLQQLATLADAAGGARLEGSGAFVAGAPLPGAGPAGAGVLARRTAAIASAESRRRKPRRRP